MNKKVEKAIQPVQVAFTVPEYWIEEQIANAVANQVEKAVEKAVPVAVAAVVGKVVDAIAKKRIEIEIDKVLAEGWATVNEYGERKGCGNRTLKDRIGEILNHKDNYGSSRRWLDEHIKTAVDAAIKAHFDADIKAARESFKTQVDGVLTGVIKKAIGDHLGVRQ
jgi:hypothetical protein